MQVSAKSPACIDVVVNCAFHAAVLQSMQATRVVPHHMQAVKLAAYLLKGWPKGKLLHSVCTIKADRPCCSGTIGSGEYPSVECC